MVSSMHFLMENSEIKENILGLSPLSPLWKFWSDNYNFKSQIIVVNLQNKMG